MREVRGRKEKDWRGERAKGKEEKGLDARDCRGLRELKGRKEKS